MPKIEEMQRQQAAPAPAIHAEPVEQNAPGQSLFFVPREVPMEDGVVENLNELIQAAQFAAMDAYEDQILEPIMFDQMEEQEEQEELGNQEEIIQYMEANGEALIYDPEWEADYYAENHLMGLEGMARDNAMAEFAARQAEEAPVYDQEEDEARHAEMNAENLAVDFEGMVRDYAAEQQAAQQWNAAQQAEEAPVYDQEEDEARHAEMNAENLAVDFEGMVRDYAAEQQAAQQWNAAVAEMAAHQALEQNAEAVAEQEIEAEQQEHAEAEQEIEAEQQENFLDMIDVAEVEVEENVNMQLLNAAEVMRRASERQRQIRESKKKSDRKRASAEKQDSDKSLLSRLQLRIRKLRSEPKNTDEIIGRTILEEEERRYHKMPPREDVTGYLRRKNEKKYGYTTPDDKKAQKAAEKDVRNLVNNLRMDLGLNEETSIPPEMKEYTDAFYFTHQYGERTVESLTRIHQANRRRGIPEDVLEEERMKLAKLEQFVTMQKSYASTFVPNMLLLQRDIQARQMALQYVYSGPASPYQTMMQDILKHEIVELQAEYNGYAMQMRTLNGTVGTPRGDAQLAMQRNLALLRQNMQEEDLTPEQKEAIEHRAQGLLLGYDYEGPVT